MTEITLAGETFNVRLEGDETKEILALAHQLGGSLTVWEPLMPALLERFRVLRWDSRGHGGSVANGGPYSVAQLARDAIAIFDALGIDKAHWLGLSMGAIVGQAAMIAAPARIRRAVLANTAAQLGTPDIWNARIQTVRQEGMEAIVGSVAARWFTAEFRRAEPEIVEAILFVLRESSPEGYAAACAALRDADQREAIRSIRNKALVIVGSDDSSAPPELGSFVAIAIEGARLVTLESAHISPIEQTDAFLMAAIDFLTAPATPARKASPTRKAPARRPSARQPLARRMPPKAPAKKAAVSKAKGKKAAVKKAAAKHASVRTAAARVVTTKAQPSRKQGAPKAAAKKSAAKKSAHKKATFKNTPFAKPTLAKTAAKKASVKTQSAKKSPAKRLAVKKTPDKAAAPERAGKKAARAGAKTKNAATKSRSARKAPRRN
jgi:3-oxoadipate enol-lactonase